MADNEEQDVVLTPEKDGRLVVVAFDPGVSTGWAWRAFDREDLPRLPTARLLRVSEGGTGLIERDPRVVPRLVLAGGVAMWDTYTAMAMQSVVRSAWKVAEVDEDLDTFVVVVEDFILRTSDAARHTLAPVRVTAAFEALMRDSGVNVFTGQSASDAKRAITDERLRRWDVYEEGPEHRRDAMRHLILFMRRWRDDHRFRGRFGLGRSSLSMGEIIARSEKKK